MKIGILTSGGDCPGLNAVIRAIARKCDSEKFEAIGIMNGWKGIMDESYKPLNLNSVAGIINRGGTILGTSRYSPFEEKGGKEKLLNKVNREGFDAIICIGGEGSHHIANMAHKLGINVVGVPKTIDNDISGTDFTFGFDTAANIATEAIDRLHTTAESHHRIMVLEVMGRHAGWIAMYSGIAGGADYILIPEKKVKIDDVVKVIMKRYKRGKLFSIIVVSEGATYIEDEIFKKNKSLAVEKKLDSFGRARLGGVGHLLANEIEKRTEFETRATILGYVQRGGVPTAFDRMLGSLYGIHSVDMVKNKRFGRMCSYRSGKMTDIPIKDAIGKLKTVDVELFDKMQVFFR